MNTAIIFLSIFIILISIMLEIKITVNFDLWANSVIIKGHIFNIKIITVTIYLVGFYYKINNSKKLKKLKLFLTKDEEYLIKQIKSSIIDKLYYDEVEFYGNIGVKSASDTAVISGYTYMLCNVVDSFLKNKNYDSSFYYHVNQNYTSRELSFYMSVKVYFTIFDLVFAAIMSFYKRGRYVKQRQKERQHR